MTSHSKVLCSTKQGLEDMWPPQGLRTPPSGYLMRSPTSVKRIASEAERVGDDFLLALQSHPAGNVNAERFQEINRRLASSELAEARGIAREAGLYRLDER